MGLPMNPMLYPMNPYVIAQAMQGRGFFKNIGKSFSKAAKSVANAGVKVYKGARKTATTVRNKIGDVPIVGKVAQQYVDSVVDAGVAKFVPGGMEGVRTFDAVVDNYGKPSTGGVSMGDRIKNKLNTLGDLNLNDLNNMRSMTKGDMAASMGDILKAELKGSGIRKRKGAAKMTKRRK